MEGAGRKNAPKAAMVDRDGIERPKNMADGASFYYIRGMKVVIHERRRGWKGAGPEDGAAADEMLEAME